jgi:Uma2 family endonuclease
MATLQTSLADYLRTSYRPDDYMDGEVQERLISRNRPAEQILTCAPMPVIEILSPEDRISRYNERLSDYRSRGIRNIWVIDPATRVA